MITYFIKENEPILNEMWEKVSNWVKSVVKLEI